MRPHENMSARNAQVHSNDVFSTKETPFLIFGPFFKKTCRFRAIAPLIPFDVVTVMQNIKNFVILYVRLRLGSLTSS